jgi:hypothetical protein
MNALNQTSNIPLQALQALEALEQLGHIGSGLVRPECVLATAAAHIPQRDDALDAGGDGFQHPDHAAAPNAPPT